MQKVRRYFARRAESRAFIQSSLAGAVPASEAVGTAGIGGLAGFCFIGPRPGGRQAAGINDQTAFAGGHFDGTQTGPKLSRRAVSLCSRVARRGSANALASCARTVRTPPTHGASRRPTGPWRPPVSIDSAGDVPSWGQKKRDVNPMLPMMTYGYHVLRDFPLSAPDLLAPFTRQTHANITNALTPSAHDAAQSKRPAPPPPRRLALRNSKSLRVPG
ncbi:hypothetical protein HIM_06023 [Hirsutella minnesotensis 3608]|uniref:Uncharacterized protein n=1 Tax=Hirsutella minnesotensis 3608 TaxID=1043627 RepID=A0A0F7ZUD5_9HYPO|nr:hypothetical protein HIM_06023 [Hirsutella minnesotensis 3608]